MVYSEDLKAFLNEKAEQYNQPRFIETDPIQVPLGFSGRENIEIAAFLTSSIAWGNRTAIIKNAGKLMAMMDDEPHEFVVHASDFELQKVTQFVHRTFNGIDLVYFILSLRNIYKHYGGLQGVFEKGYQTHASVFSALKHFYNVFFELQGERTRKHIANVERGASAKRLNMFLRWMCRKDSKGVDFGLWENIPVSKLMLPLDVHTGNVGRKLGILKRKSNDWKAVEEITAALRYFDPEDPVKYDFALFGLGVFEKF